MELFNSIKLQLKQLEITYILIGINIFLYILSLLVSIISFNSSALGLILMGANNSALILNGEVWRFITSAFLHAGIIHIVLNMYALWSLGLFTERFYGSKQLVITYFLSALGGSFLSFVSNLLFWNSSSGGALNGPISVGASGAIFGILGLITGTVFIKRRYGADLPIDKNQLIIILILNLGYGLMPGTGIDIAAHIGGFLIGLILSFLFTPVHSFNGLDRDSKLIKAGYYICIFIFIISFTLQLIWSINTIFN